MVCFTEPSEKSSLENVWKRAEAFQKKKQKKLGRQLDKPSVYHELTSHCRHTYCKPRLQPLVLYNSGRDATCVCRQVVETQEGRGVYHPPRSPKKHSMTLSQRSAGSACYCRQPRKTGAHLRRQRGLNITAMNNTVILKYMNYYQHGPHF